VECGSPILGLVFASLMKGYLSLHFYENFDGLYVVYMVILSRVFLLLLVHYMCVLWEQLCMDLSMFLLVNEWIMYLWPNRW